MYEKMFYNIVGYWLIDFLPILINMLNNMIVNFKAAWLFK